MDIHWTAYEGRGPHLLLVHGFLSSKSQWLGNLEALSRVSRPVAIDLLGHGASAAPDDPSRYRPEAYLDAFETIRRALGAERWIVCGYSLGAGLTLRYAIEQPERVIGHLFTNSSSGLADDAQLAQWRAGAARIAAHVRAAGKSAIEAMAVHPRQARQLSGPVYEAVLADAERLDPIGIAHTLEHTNPNISMRARLDENTRPALLVCGRRERRFRDKRDFAAAQMPLLQVADVEAGHAVNMEAQAEFDRVVTEFISGLDRD